MQKINNEAGMGGPMQNTHLYILPKKVNGDNGMGAPNACLTFLKDKVIY